MKRQKVMLELKHLKQADILITGTTSSLGKELTKILDKNKILYTSASSKKVNGSNVVQLNLRTLEGIESAVLNRKLIVHIASDKEKPDNDISGTEKILSVLEENNQRPHFIYISIVGMDEVNGMAYYKQKYLTEQVIKKHRIPWTILRATQFHSFVDEMLTKGLSFPIGILPKKILVQPIDIVTVAEATFQLMKEEASFDINNLGGRETFTLYELAKSKMKFEERNKFILNLPLFGKAGKALKKGALVTEKSTNRGITWNEYLQNK